MKDKTSKQCFLKNCIVLFDWYALLLFLLYLVFLVWVGLWEGGCGGVVCFFVVYMGIKMKVAWLTGTPSKQSFVSRTTEDMRCISSYSLRCIMLT